MTIVTAANESTVKPVYFHKPPFRAQFSLHLSALPPHFWTTSINRIWKNWNSTQSLT